jgi:hypothetical protein
MLLADLEREVMGSGIHNLVSFSVNQSRVESGPRWHQQTLFIALNIDHAVFILHQVLEARCRVKHSWDADGGTKEPKKRHFINY